MAPTIAVDRRTGCQTPLSPSPFGGGIWESSDSPRYRRRSSTQEGTALRLRRHLRRRVASARASEGTPDSGAIYREPQSGCVRPGALPRKQYDASERGCTSPERVFACPESSDPVRIPRETRTDSIFLRSAGGFRSAIRTYGGANNEH
jgi:hypothetical protein